MMNIDEIQQQKLKENFCVEVGVQINDTCYWDVIKEELVGSQKSKALKFNRLKLIKSNGDGSFSCLPILGYNRTTYHLSKGDDGWDCNCQYKNKNPDKECSHTIALALFLKNGGVE